MAGWDCQQFSFTRVSIKRGGWQPCLQQGGWCLMILGVPLRPKAFYNSGLNSLFVLTPIREQKGESSFIHSSAEHLQERLSHPQPAVQRGVQWHKQLRGSPCVSGGYSSQCTPWGHTLEPTLNSASKTKQKNTTLKNAEERHLNLIEYSWLEDP